MIDLRIVYVDTQNSKNGIARDSVITLGNYETNRSVPTEDAELYIAFGAPKSDNTFFETVIHLQEAISLRNGLNQFIHEAEISEQRDYERFARAEHERFVRGEGE